MIYYNSSIKATIEYSEQGEQETGVARRTLFFVKQILVENGTVTIYQDTVSERTIVLKPEWIKTLVIEEDMKK